MSRPKNCRFVDNNKEECCKKETAGVVKIYSDELEALRLNSIESLHQIDSATQMGVSRATYGRILKSCLRKIAVALVDGHQIEIIDVPWVVSKNKEKESVMKKIIALPVLENVGNPEVSEHFGHAPYFAIVSINDNSENSIGFIENKHEGGCGDVVNLLKVRDVEVLLVKGIGGRPKIACDQMGINVYRANGFSVNECVSAWTAGANETNVSCNHDDHGKDQENCHKEN